jgi:hypothetical protein
MSRNRRHIELLERNLHAVFSDHAVVASRQLTNGNTETFYVSILSAALQFIREFEKFLPRAVFHIKKGITSTEISIEDMRVELTKLAA